MKRYLLMSCALLSFAACKTREFGETSSPERRVSRASLSIVGSYKKIADETGTKEFLSQREFQEIFQDASQNPVASLSQLSKYDPQGLVGFCFGRAMTVHLLAKQTGVKTAAIKKLFIVGDLRSREEPEWRFHVTTVIRNQRGEWTAVDPITPKPMLATEWIRYVSSIWDKRNKAHLYLVDADVVMPDITTVKPLNQEQGDRLIEISFRPERERGFTAERELGRNVFAVEKEQQDTHFIAVSETQEAFDFEGITANGGRISYNNYFKDLMDSLNGQDIAGASVGPRSTAHDRTVPTYKKDEMPLGFSPRLFERRGR